MTPLILEYFWKNSTPPVILLNYYPSCLPLQIIHFRRKDIKPNLHIAKQKAFFGNNVHVEA